MNSSPPLILGPRQLRRAILLVVAVWTLTLAGSVAWNARLLHEGMWRAALHDARTSCSKDLAYLLNPAFMTREVHQLNAQSGDLLGHITRLNPVRPENAPDAWEAAALRSLKPDQTEVSSRELYQGTPHLRFMQPLIIKPSCLECHADHGFKVGDVGGGITVAVPLDPYVELARAQLWPIAGVHSGLWALGLLGIALVARQFRRRMEQQLQAEVTLRRSETKFRTLYDANSDAVLLVVEQRLGDCNPAALAMFGCATREELGAKQLADLSPPQQPGGGDSQTLNKQHLATALEKGSHHFEWTYKRVDTGATFPAEVLLNRMELDGNLVVQAVVRDISARKQAEAKLVNLSRVVEQTPTSVVITDVAGNIQYVNPAFVTGTGYTAEEAMGQNPRILKSGLMPEETYTEMWRQLKAGETWRGELQNRRKDGQLYWELVVISPVKGRSGKTLNYVAIKENITKRKAAEAALRASEIKLHTLVENIPQKLFIKDRNLRFVTVNANFARDLRLRPEEIVGKSDHDLFAKELADQYHADDERIIRSGQAEKLEQSHLRDGREVWELVTKIPVRDAGGEVTGVFASFQDMTERKEAELKLAENEKYLRTIVESEPKCVKVMNAEGLLTMMNPAGLALLDADSQE